MCERDFARLWNSSATNHSGVRDRVVWTAERSRAEKRFAGSQLAHSRVDACCFETFVGRKWRQDSGQPASEHRLARSWRAKHQHIVCAAGGNHECSLRELLSAYLRKVDGVLVQLLHLVGWWGDRVDGCEARDDSDGFGQRADAEDFDFANHCGFAGVRCGDDELCESACACFHCHRQRPEYRADIAVEGQFPHDGKRFKLVGSDLPHRDEQAQRDGQVECSRVFTQVGRSEIDDCSAGWESVAEIYHRPFDAVDALAYRHFGQAHDHRFRLCGWCRIDFDLYRNGVDTEQSERVELGKHSVPSYRLLGNSHPSEFVGLPPHAPFVSTLDLLLELLWRLIIDEQSHDGEAGHGNGRHDVDGNDERDEGTRFDVERLLPVRTGLIFLQKGASEPITHIHNADDVKNNYPNE